MQSQPPNPYLRLMRMHQPVGVWLVYWPCVWSLLLASAQRPAITATDLAFYIALFFLGALVTRAGGCIVNDLADREFDKQVARTRTRPLASGELTPMQGLGLLAVCGFAALAVLVTLITTLPQGVAPLDLLRVTLPVVALIVAYPFMKRITWWPQAFLGITFNWGVLIGWATLHGQLSAAALWLYAACVFWTLGYDTIYGHQDKRDDEKIGVKSTSRYLEKGGKWWIGGFYLAMVLCLGRACHLAGLPASISALVALAALGHSLWQLRRWNPDEPANCLMIFKSNVSMGALLALALGVGLAI